MFQSKIYDQVIGEINTSLGNFLKTGVFRDDYTFDTDLNKWTPRQIPEPTMRKVARAMASEMKRPFIMAGKYRTRKYDVRDGNKIPWSELPIIFVHGYIQIPRVKYLSPIINPLMLASTERQYRYGAADGVSHYIASKWISFNIKDEELFDDYLARLVENEDMRKAILYRGKDRELERPES